MNQKIEAIKELLNKGISPPPIDACDVLDDFEELPNCLYVARQMKIPMIFFNTHLLSQAQRDTLRRVGKGYATLNQ